MMKKMKKVYALVIAAVLMCSTMLLWACGNDSNVDENGEVAYKVTVKNALGDPYTSGVVVKFMKDGEQSAMQVCDENGVATKKLKAGDYTVELSFTDGEEGYYYNKENLSLSSEDNELEVTVAYAVNSEPTVLYSAGEEYDAYGVGVGCTYLELKAEGRNYFLFTPTEAGTYQFSVADGADVTIGTYGSPFFITEVSTEEVKDNVFKTSIKPDMIGTEGTGGTVMVIGVDANNGDANHCVLGIKRTGDYELGIEDEPWTVYNKTTELSEYKLPDGAVIEEFDLTASTDKYKLVYNEEDGFYHMDSEDGPLVLVHLTEDPGYTSCFKAILENAAVRKYFFDEDGELEKKEEYSECLLEYVEYADEATGLYPLTEDLKYIIQQYGDASGWWDKDGVRFIFVDKNGNKLTDINTEIAWLFMCCYVTQN